MTIGKRAAVPDRLPCFELAAMDDVDDDFAEARERADKPMLIRF